MQRVGAADIIELINEYPEFRPKQLIDILDALIVKLSDQIHEAIDLDRPDIQNETANYRQALKAARLTIELQMELILK